MYTLLLPKEGELNNFSKNTTEKAMNAGESKSPKVVSDRIFDGFK